MLSPTKKDIEWGQTARKLSIGQRGTGHAVEIGGLNTLAQCSPAVAVDGSVAAIGTRGGKNEFGSSSIHANLFSTCRIMAGNRLQFEGMNRALMAKNIKPS
jgi:NADPH:quinone reductase-like Zn-dependent oxidoreductase